MSSNPIPTAIPVQAAKQSLERTVSDLKSIVTTAATASSDMSEKAAKTSADVTAFSRDTFMAMTEASQIFATESQDLLRQMLTSGQTAMTESLSGLRAMMSAKTVKEGMELQATLARTTAIWAVSESSRFARAGIDMAEKVAAPVTARAHLVAETFSPKA